MFTEQTCVSCGALHYNQSWYCDACSGHDRDDDERLETISNIEKEIHSDVWTERKRRRELQRKK